MEQQHLAVVEHVEPRADADRVQAVLGLGGDPLRVEVRLDHVAGERGPDRAEERDRAGDPGHRATAAPGGHEELAPQVDDHGEEEQLDAPQVQAVDEVADRRHVPPLRALEGQDHAGDEHDDQRGEGRDTEDVDPGRDVGGLPVGQQPLGRERGHGPVAQPRGPHPLVAGGCRSFLPPRERQRARRATNTTSINTMTTRFATEIWMTPQCR